MNKLKSNFSSPLLICGTVIFLFLFESVRVNSFDTLSTVLSKEFKLNAFQYARLSSAYLFGNLIFLIPYGVLLDRISIKKVLLFSVMLCSLTALGEGVSHSYHLVLSFSFLAGVGASPVFIIAMRLIKENFSEKHLASLTGVLVSAAMIGGIFSQSPLLYFLNCFSWHYFFFILATLEFGLFLLFFFMEIKSTNQNVVGGVRQMGIDLLSSIKNSANWMSGFFTSLLNLPVTLIGALWGQSYLQVVKHFSAKQASFVIIFIFIGSILGLPIVGYISDKTQNRTRYMLFGATICFACSIFMLIATSKSVIMFVVIFFIFGIASSAQSLGYALACENNPIQKVGVAMGFIGVIVMSGGAFLQPLIGFWIDFGKPLNSTTSNLLQYNAHNYQLSFIIFPIAFFIAVLLVFALRLKYK